MEDSQALIGLLDRLANVRQVSAAATRPTPRADTPHQPELERTPLGAVAARRDSRSFALVRATHLPHKTLGHRRAALIAPGIRGTFALVNEFRAAVEARADPHWLGILLHAVGQDAASTFDAAAKLWPETPEFSADKARCMGDLERVFRALRGQDPPTGRELAHAMDALIVQLVRLTGR